MYTLEAARLNSYITFPYIKEVKTDKLVQAGFFYSGRGDNVNCYCCGGALHYQIADDNPWFHHTRCYGNNCLFIRVKKGLHYIDGVLKIFKEMRERIRNLNEDMAVASELDCLICREKERNIVFLPCEHLAVCKSCLFSVKECIICRKNLKQVLVTSFDKASSDDDLGDVINGGKDERANKIVCNCIRKRFKNEETKKLLLCKICCKNQRNVVFMPCGHLEICNSCSPTIKCCTACEKPFNRLLNIFLS
ncbi:baculoviral IAP repeat-containing protein 8-like [Lycorma delicatula]|uniref:baculoviral IAP repeat-containing protein 8-like n=1 Tax=Lycorma delicatula TaxID=130591 RepID=UPI003F515A39